MTEKKKISIVPITAGEVFLQDKVIDDKHCYICKKILNKYDTSNSALLRIKKGLMGFCCTDHRGVVKEFIRQFNRVPFGWEIPLDE